jgi:hypothetical protein
MTLAALFDPAPRVASTPMPKLAAACNRLQGAVTASKLESVDAPYGLLALDHRMPPQHPVAMPLFRKIYLPLAICLTSTGLVLGCEEKKSPPRVHRKDDWNSWFKAEYSRATDDGFDVARALRWRAWQEIELANLAAQDYAGEEERKHLQRAADFELAAATYFKTGKYPPGFDADLATK